ETIREITLVAPAIGVHAVGWGIMRSILYSRHSQRERSIETRAGKTGLVRERSRLKDVAPIKPEPWHRAAMPSPEVGMKAPSAATNRESFPWQKRTRFTAFPHSPSPLSRSPVAFSPLPRDRPDPLSRTRRRPAPS